MPSTPPPAPSAFARRVADGLHDLNNWLAVVLNSAEVLRLTLPGGTPAAGAAARIADAALKAGAECRRLADEARGLMRPPAADLEAG